MNLKLLVICHYSDRKDKAVEGAFMQASAYASALNESKLCNVVQTCLIIAADDSTTPIIYKAKVDKYFGMFLKQKTIFDNQRYFEFIKFLN